MRTIADKPQERKVLTLKEFIIKNTIKYSDKSRKFFTWSRKITQNICNVKVWFEAFHALKFIYMNNIQKIFHLVLVWRSYTH